MLLLKSMESNWDLCPGLSKYAFKLLKYRANGLFILIFLCTYFGLPCQAAVNALQHQPIVNAVIDGDDIIYRDYVDISIAVGTKKVFISQLDLFSFTMFIM